MRFYIVLFLLFSFIFSSCKSEFEKIRTSSDPKIIYKKALELYDQEEYVKAQTLFELAIPYYRGKEQAEELFYKYAQTYYHMESYIMASHYFDNFSKTFYNSDKKEEASYLSAYSLYKMSPNFRLDQTYSKKAEESFQRFVNTYPNSPKIKKCNEIIDDIRVKKEAKAFYNAELYYNLKRYKSAIQTFENILKEFPDSKNEEKIKFLLLDASYSLAENSIYELKEKRYDTAVKFFKSFIEKFPKSKYKKRAEKIEKNSLIKIKEIESNNKLLKQKS